MTAPRLLFRPLLVGAAAALIVALFCPAYHEVLDEPSPGEDPFYYVDYHKRDAYRTRRKFVWGWGWSVGLASGLSAGVAGCIVMLRTAERNKAAT
jgi:hypothetical protein